MKRWEQHCAIGLFTVMLGIVLFAWGASIYIPSVYKTFLGIPYDVNPEFFNIVDQKISLGMISFFFFGMGSGVLASTLTIHEFEKKD
jgi:cell division protein FtsX